jgi:RimJ/RimL family protein N-acetyltransferase
MALLMTSADLAVGAGGTMSWERCCMALPALILSTAGNQRENAAALARRGAAIDLGDADGGMSERVAAATHLLLSRPAQRASMASAAASLCDGRGTDRVALAMVKPVRLPSGEYVDLSLAELEHEDLILDWQSVPGVRCYARVPEIPTKEEHSLWYEAAMADPERIVMLIRVDGIEVGVLRFDFRPNDGSIEISIFVTPDSQRRGIAGAALRLARALAPGATLDAWIDPRNTASLMLFQRSGYVRISSTLHRSLP